MKSDFDQVEDRARALSPEERAKLAESMLESLHPPLADVESAWAEEIERRVEAFDRGELPSYPAEDVFAEARRSRRNVLASLRLLGANSSGKSPITTAKSQVSGLGSRLPSKQQRSARSLSR